MEVKMYCTVIFFGNFGGALMFSVTYEFSALIFIKI